jgi:hypothetical protein
VIATRPQSRHLGSLEKSQLTLRPKYRRFRRSDRLSALLLEELFAMFSRGRSATRAVVTSVGPEEDPATQRTATTGEPETAAISEPL